MSRKKPLVFVEHSRSENQRKKMEEILEKGICPFCPEFVDSFGPEKCIRKGQFWSLRENSWPYKGAKLHLLVIHNTHVEIIPDLKKEAWLELLEFVKHAEQIYKIKSGSLAIRFGVIGLNGSSVAHLHCHIIVPDTDATERLRFPMGPKQKKKS